MRPSGNVNAAMDTATCNKPRPARPYMRVPFRRRAGILFSIDSAVGRVILSLVCIYILLTFLPNLRLICPYRTPFSGDTLKWFLVVPTVPALLGSYCSRCLLRKEMFERVRLRFLLFVQSLLWARRALQWTVATIGDDDDIKTFLEGIPGYLTSGRNALSVVEDLLDLQRPKPLGHHINRLIQTCTPPRGLPRRRRERAQAPGPHLPARLLAGSTLCSPMGCSDTRLGLR